jgi:hypothetical protein
MDERVYVAYTVMRTIAIDTAMTGPCCLEYINITVDTVSRKRRATDVTNTGSSNRRDGASKRSDVQ